jgi:anti-sigma factor RsiW
MNCEQLEELLSEFIDGELAPAVGAGAEAHLAVCELCAASHKRMLRTVRFVRSNADVDIVPGTTGALYSAFTRAHSDPASPHSTREAIRQGGFEAQEGDHA